MFVLHQKLKNANIQDMPFQRNYDKNTAFFIIIPPGRLPPYLYIFERWQVFPLIFVKRKQGLYFTKVI